MAVLRTGDTQHPPSRGGRPGGDPDLLSEASQVLSAACPFLEAINQGPFPNLCSKPTQVSFCPPAVYNIPLHPLWETFWGRL